MYGRYTGYDYSSVDGHFRLDFAARTRISVVAPEQVGEVIPGGAAPPEPSMLGFTVAVTDLDRVRDLLKKNHVPFREFRSRLVVAAADACSSPCCSRHDPFGHGHGCLWTNGNDAGPAMACGLR
jgi:hypothetical protein